MFSILFSILLNTLYTSKMHAIPTWFWWLWLWIHCSLTASSWSCCLTMFLNFGLHFNTARVCSISICYVRLIPLNSLMLNYLSMVFFLQLLMLYSGAIQRSLLCILFLLGSVVHSLISYRKTRWRSTWRSLDKFFFILQSVSCETL